MEGGGRGLYFHVGKKTYKSLIALVITYEIMTAIHFRLLKNPSTSDLYIFADILAMFILLPSNNNNNNNNNNSPLI